MPTFGAGRRPGSLHPHPPATLPIKIHKVHSLGKPPAPCCIMPDGKLKAIISGGWGESPAPLCYSVKICPR